MLGERYLPMDPGHEDLALLRGIASALASRDGELKQVIVNLDGITQELARSDRRQ